MIVDAHTDVLLELVIREEQKPSFELVLRCGEAGVFKRYWLTRLAAGDVGVQICPLYGEGARRRDARARTLAQEAASTTAAARPTATRWRIRFVVISLH